MRESTKALVIGGGPAGSTAASLLAREGVEVVLLERDTFPRYHIGESLLPTCLYVFNLLGAREKLEKHGFIKKTGAYFHWGPEQWDYQFGALSGNHTYGFQVVRSEFDQILLDHARELGAEVHEGVEVERLDFDGDRPVGAVWRPRDGGEGGRLSFDYLVDASGRNGLMATRYLRSRHFHKAFRNVAVWGYWEGVEPLEKAPEGAILVASISDGWFWGIPLHDGRMSIGVVLSKDSFKERRKRLDSLEEVYLEALEECTLIRGLTRKARLVSELGTDQDYSYASETFSGPGFFICGDAACFLDPLLSSGVHLATYSAVLAAASIVSLLRGEVSDDEAAGFFDKTYRQSYLRLLAMVSNFYHYNRNKESHFWEAQQLSSHDCSQEDLQQAFIEIVSGVEDLRDAEEGVHEKVMRELSKLHDYTWGLMKNREKFERMDEEERERVVSKARFYNSVIGRFSLNPESAVDGLYLVTQPRFGLGRISRPVAATASVEA